MSDAGLSSSIGCVRQVDAFARGNHVTQCERRIVPASRYAKVSALKLFYRFSWPACQKHCINNVERYEVECPCGCAAWSSSMTPQARVAATGRLRQQGVAPFQTSRPGALPDSLDNHEETT